MRIVKVCLLNVIDNISIFHQFDFRASFLVYLVPTDPAA